VKEKKLNQNNIPLQCMILKKILCNKIICYTKILSIRGVDDIILKKKLLIYVVWKK